MSKRKATTSAGSGDTKRQRIDYGAADADQTWKRPPVPAFDPAKDAVVFQQVDSDNYLGWRENIPFNHRNNNNKMAIIRMYGCTEAGNSVLLHIHSFAPYFYVKAWKGFDSSNQGVINAQILAFQNALEATLKQDQASWKGGREQRSSYVLRVELVQKMSLWGYQFKRLQPFLKIYLVLPRLITRCRFKLRISDKDGRGGLVIQGVNGNRPVDFQLYEAKVDHALRYMIDMDIVGGGWVELPAGTYCNATTKSSRCQIEVHTEWNTVVGVSMQQKQDMAPIRICSFDIECTSRPGIFPEAAPKKENGRPMGPETGDAVIQISNVVTLQGSGGVPIVKNIFCLKETAPICGVDVRSFQTEKELLAAWAEFIQIVDPDFLTGYNIINFDLPYLLERAEHIKLAQRFPKSFPYLGRITNKQCVIKTRVFESKGYGKSESKDINIEGRVQFDLYPIIKRNHKLRSYSLNNVAFHFLKKQKEDVHYSIISDLQNGDAQSRRRLAVYCVKDSVLCIDIMEKLLLVINYVEMARVTGVPINYLIVRGQQIKVLSQLYRKTKHKNIVIPNRKRVNSGDGVAFEGATVLEPIRGYYTIPITTLDFASLYPTIMQAHNLCYTTQITQQQAKALDRKNGLQAYDAGASLYTKTPKDGFFVKKHVQEGLLPEILRELLAQRKVAKKDMKQAKKDGNTFLKNVMNGRQLALKVSANSVYGFTGAMVGELPNLMISGSVTAFGREMIDHTKKMVEEHYTKANGYQNDAVVVYGDTDSVMIKFGIEDMAENMRLGYEAAELVTKTFIKPIELEFEKCYLPWLLMNKKRYAGMLYTKPDKWDYMDAKGIETVRRDNSGLVRKTLQQALDHLLIDRDADLAQAYVKRQISRLLQNKMDLSDLVISKSLGKGARVEDYKSKMPHVVLAEKLYKRDPATAPKVGDRVPYVVCQGPKGARTYEKAEDPLYALENGIPIDFMYYLNNQLKKPLLRIFEPILGEGKVNHLFEGAHTRKVKKVAKKMGGLMRFAKVVKKCMGCKCRLRKGEKALCRSCKDKEAIIYISRAGIVRNKETEFHKLWTQCQRCQGSCTQKVICSNNDCPIFYRRSKARLDLEEARTALAEFEM